MIQVANTHSLFLTHCVGHLVLKGDQAGQAASAFQEALWAGPGPLVVLHVPCDSSEEDLLCDLPSAQVKLMDEHHIC